MPPAGRVRARTRRPAARPAAAPPPNKFEPDRIEYIELENLDSGIDGKAFLIQNSKPTIGLKMDCGDRYDILVADLEDFLAAVKKLKPTYAGIIDNFSD